MKIAILIPLLFVITFIDAIGQKENYHWMCEDTFGLDFNTPDLYPVQWQIPIYEDTCSSIPCDQYSPYYAWYRFGSNIVTVSDSNGNYLFNSYGGINIWNKKHKMICSCKDLGWDTLNNSDGIKDHWYYGWERDEINYVVKKPGTENIYYNFFSTGESCYPYNYHDCTHHIICYNVIDADMNGGAAGLKKAHQELYSYYSTYYYNNSFYWFVPVRHANKKDYWIVVFRSDTVCVFSYLLTENGIDTANPVVSQIGSDLFDHYHREYRDYSCTNILKVSPKGNLIAFSPDLQGGIHICNFDPLTGKISLNYMTIKTNNIQDSNFYYFSSIEFSSDGSKLYHLYYDSNGQHQTILGQYDLNNKGKFSVIDSLLTASYHYTYADWNSNLLQIGPGGRIYVLTHHDDWQPNDNRISSYATVSIITRPNEMGKSCDYIKKYLTVGCGLYPNVNYYYRHRSIFLSYPTSVHDDYDIQIKADGSTQVCEGDTIFLKSRVSPFLEGVQYFWTGPAGFTSYLQNPIIPKAGISKSGAYIVKFELWGFSGRDTVFVSVKPKPLFQIIGETTFCKGDSSLLSSNDTSNTNTYLWSTGDTTHSIVVKDEGRFFLTVENEYGCRNFDSVQVTYLPVVYPEIKTSNGVTSICEGESLKLKAEPDGSGYRYSWSTGDTTREITVNKTGTYAVTVSSDGLCSGKALIDIKVNHNPTVKIEGVLTLCKGDEAVLRSDKDFSTYLWSTGETTKEIKITKGGLYSVSIIDTNGCPASASIEVKDLETNLSSISDMDFGRFCTGEEKIDKITIRNEGQEEVKIKEVRSQNNIPFFSLSSVPAFIQPGKEAKVKVAFKPHEVGLYKDTVVIEVSAPCAAIYKAEIKGIGTAKTLAELPEITAQVEDKVSIPLMLQLVCGESLPKVAEYAAEVKYEASALLPDQFQESNVSEKGISIGERVFTIVGNVLATKSIKGKTLLARQDTTALKIGYFRWKNEFIESETIDGKLIITGLCRRNLLRVETFEKLSISVTPFPALEEAEISIQGDFQGNLRLSFYSITGVKMTEILLDKNNLKINNKLDLKDYPAGIYQIVVQSKNELTYVPVVIVK